MDVLYLVGFRNITDLTYATPTFFLHFFLEIYIISSQGSIIEYVLKVCIIKKSTLNIFNALIETKGHILPRENRQLALD